MSAEFWITTFVAMAIQSAIYGTVNHGKVVDRNQTFLNAFLFVAYAITVYALSLYWN